MLYPEAYLKDRLQAMQKYKQEKQGEKEASHLGFANSKSSSYDLNLKKNITILEFKT